MTERPTARPDATGEPRVRKVSRSAGGRIAWVAMAVGLVFLVLAVVFASRFGSDPGVSSSPLVGRQAPSGAIALQDGSGDISLGDLSGDIVVVNFWASWCPGCRTEHDALVTVADEYAEFGVTFVAVNYQDAPGRATEFLNEFGTSDRTIYAVDEGSSTAFAWGVLGLPETFFVDRDGTVVGKVSGPVDVALLTQTIDQVILGEAIGAITTGEVENR
jgi:cytochrome c biogenesis protein CcmG, thiol:disulfide interchange protein DsbE